MMMVLWSYVVLVAVTAVAVVYLPRLLRTPPPIIVDGFVAPGFEHVLNAFRENFECGADSRYGGSAFTAYHRGVKVVDIWGGYADQQSQRKWTQDTMSIFFSTTKGVASVCIAVLADRGLLDYNKPVADYWPEFAQKGKDKVTVRQMMEHKAGVVLAAPPGLSLDVLQDVAKAGELMASAEPLWVPDGRTHGYHGLSFGPLVNELLRRVDPQHRTMGQFFREEIAEPFGIDFHIGLPLEMNHRVARLMVDDRSPMVQLLSILTSPHTRQLMFHNIRTGSLGRMMKNCNELANLNVYNDPAYRAIEIPSANGIGTSPGLAKLYNILAMGGTDPVTNKTLLSRETIDAMMDGEPPSVDVTLGLPLTFSHGMIITDINVEGVKAMGTTGAGGQQGWIDPTNQVALSFLSRFMVPYMRQDDMRFTRIVRALYQCIDTLNEK